VRHYDRDVSGPSLLVVEDDPDTNMYVAHARRPGVSDDELVEAAREAISRPD
jgi:hypothetical protein